MSLWIVWSSAILRWAFLAGNSMKRAFESQKHIKVSLARVYNGSLVLKTEEKSLSKTATFLTSANLNRHPHPNVESTLSVAQWVWMAPLIQNAKHLKNKNHVLPNWHIFGLFCPWRRDQILIENNHISVQLYLKHN